MEKLELERIKFLSEATNIQRIEKGYSGAVKFSFEKAGERYFLKIGRFGINFDLEQILIEAAIPHPAIVEIGQYSETMSYVVENFVDGENLKDALDRYGINAIYNFGLEIGQKYRNLRKVYPDQPVPQSLCDEYAESTGRKIKELKELLKVGEVDSESKRKILTIAGFLQNSLPCVQESLMVYGHTDVKPSNFLIRNDRILAMDIEITEYKEVTASMIWSFARVDYKDERNLAFAHGYLDGLFSHEVPTEVWTCCNHNYAFNMVSYFVKYLRGKDYEKLGRLLRHIETNYLVDRKIIVDKCIQAQK